SSPHTRSERFAEAASSLPGASPFPSAQTASPPPSLSFQLPLPCVPAPPAPHHPLFAVRRQRPTESPSEQSARSTRTNATGSKTSNPESSPPSCRSCSPVAPTVAARPPSPLQSNRAPPYPTLA